MGSSLLSFLVIVFSFLQLFCCADENITEILRLPSFKPNIQAVSDHVCGKKAYKGANSHSLITTSVFKCELGNSTEQNGISISFKHRLTPFDGLGHYLFMLVTTLLNDGNAYKNAKRFMAQDMSTTMVYLADIEGVYQQNHSNSFYCHQFTSMHDHGGETLETSKFPLQFLLHTHFECFLVPQLDEWFGFNLIRQDRLWTLPRAYSASADKSSIKCGKTSIGQKKEKTLEISYHFRLGDILAGAHLFTKDSHKGMMHETMYARLMSTLQGAVNVFNWLAELNTAMEVIGWNIHTSIYSDSPFEVIQNFLQQEKDSFGEIVPIDFFSNGILRHQRAKVVDNKKNSSFTVEFIGDSGNPLIALHCLSNAHLLIRDPASNFSKLAAMLSVSSNSANPSTLKVMHIDQIVQSLRYQPDNSNIGILGEYFYNDAIEGINAKFVLPMKHVEGDESE